MSVIPRASIRARACARLSRRLARAILALSLPVLGAVAQAQLVLTVSPSDQTGAAGSTFLFAGTVTNETGAPLTTSDLFLDFAGFDPSYLSSQQVLGSTFETIADGATSGALPLFQLTLSPAAVAGGTYRADVTLQDSFGVASDPVTVSVSVLPEPSASLLILGSLVPFGLWTWRQRSLAHRRAPGHAAQGPATDLRGAP